MRLVIDNNQLLPFLEKAVAARARPQVTLAPYVFAEALLHKAQQTADLLQSTGILFGHEPLDVMEAVAELDEEGILAFRPYNTGFTLPATVRREDISAAQKVKERHRAFGANMFSRAKRLRRPLEDARIAHKFSDFSEALELLEPSFIRPSVFEWVSHKNSRAVTVPDEKSLYAAVMRNPHLSRYFKIIFYYVISYSRLWVDQVRNFDPSPSIDDWTDITLPLYAADGDVILTADKKLRTAIRTVDPSDTVHAKTIQDL